LGLGREIGAEGVAVKDGIDWAEVGAGGRFEKIVSTLLSTLHLDSERIDGAGGDGGRDHQWRTGDRLELWQSRYYLRRLSESQTRKRHITESLIAAAAHQPDSWTLVTPMVPNPEEHTWFDGLQASYPFPLIWRGGDWLAARLAEHPSIVRHFMSANDEYISLLRELRQEQEALVEGLSAAVPRIEQLAAKVNDSNPFYKVDYTVRDGQVDNWTLRPKYFGAEKDSPVTIQFNVVAGRADAELVKSVRSAFEWGESVALPASHVNNIVVTGPPSFGGTYDQADITIGPAEEPVDLSLRLVIRRPDGQHVAALPAQLSTRRWGSRGVTLHGRDVTGVIDARLRLDWTASQFSLSLNCSWSRPLLPGAALPVLRFMQHAMPPNTLSFSIGDALSTTPVAVPAGIAASEHSVRMVEYLYRLQAAAGEPFPVPRELTMEDQREVHRAVRLLDGLRVRVGDGPVHLNTDNPQPFIEAVGRSELFSLSATRRVPYVAHVAGHDLDLGPCTFYIPQARLDPSSVAPTADGTYQLSVLPNPDSGIEIALGESTKEDG
jgi:hypothetical protein